MCAVNLLNFLKYNKPKKIHKMAFGVGDIIFLNQPTLDKSSTSCLVKKLNKAVLNK